jgi:hypothetical protein
LKTGPFFFRMEEENSRRERGVTTRLQYLMVVAGERRLQVSM